MSKVAILDPVLQEGHMQMAQNGRNLQWGTFTFNGTDLTDTLEVHMRQVETAIIIPNAARAAVVRPMLLTLGAVAATTEFLAIAPFAGTIAGVSLVNSAADATSDTNYWSLGVVNKTGPVTVVDSTAAANTTKATGGSAVVAYAARALTLTANVAVAAGDVLTFTATKTGAPTSLAEAALLIQFQAVSEEVYCSDLAAGPFSVPVGGTLNIARSGAAGVVTNNLPCSYFLIGM